MLFDLVRVRVLSTGTGPLQIGGADGGGRSFAAAGVTAGKKISYGIADGTARETGTGTFDGTFVSRGFRASTSATAIVTTEQIADNATTGVTTGVRAANTVTPAFGWWIVAVGATGGAVTFNFRSEVAGSAVTLKAGLCALAARAI